LSRTFDVSRQRVFDAMTQPEILKCWFGQPVWELVGCEIDLRTGGECRLVLRDQDGVESTMHGTYHEIVRPERIVRSESFEGWPTVESTIVLEEVNGKTTMTATIRYPSQEVRDADIAAGMERDAAAAYQTLARYLEES
jgi:uncharacterized protein YndB with AHSA1/START domain